MPGRRTFLFLIGTALGVLFLWLAVRRLDWGEFATALAHADWFAIALGFACLLAYYAIKAMRWRYLIAPFASARTGDLLPAVLAGLAGNYVLPHAGEFARAWLAGRRIGAAPGALLGSIAIERFFDFLALLVIVLVALVPLGALVPDIRAASLFAAVLCAGLLAGVLLFVLRTEACLAVGRRMLAPFPPQFAASAEHHLRQARLGLGAIAAPRLAVPAFGLSVLQWLVILGCVACSLRAVGVPVTVAGSVSVLLLNVIGLTLPAAPGHVGTIQLAFWAGLAPFGVEQEQAFAASVVYNFLMVVPTVLLGLPGLRQAGAALRDRKTPA